MPIQFFILLLIIVVGTGFIISGLKGAIWVPAFSKDTDAAIKQLKLKPGTKVYEFGCGDGRFLRKVAAKGAFATGYEINPFVWTIAWLLSRRKNVKVKLGNAWDTSFGPADVVFAFLMPKFMEQLGTKLNKELKPGSIVLTYAYPIPNMEHYLLKNNCYFYRIGKS